MVEVSLVPIGFGGGGEVLVQTVIPGYKARLRSLNNTKRTFYY